MGFVLKVKRFWRFHGRFLTIWSLDNSSQRRLALGPGSMARWFHAKLWSCAGGSSCPWQVLHLWRSGEALGWSSKPMKPNWGWWHWLYHGLPHYWKRQSRYPHCCSSAVHCVFAWQWHALIFLIPNPPLVDQINKSTLVQSGKCVGEMQPLFCSNSFILVVKLIW